MHRAINLTLLTQDEADQIILFDLIYLTGVYILQKTTRGRGVLKVPLETLRMITVTSRLFLAHFEKNLTKNAINVIFGDNIFCCGVAEECQAYLYPC